MEQLQLTFHNADVRIVSKDPVTVVLKDVGDALGYRAPDLKRSIKDKYCVVHKVHDASGRPNDMICVTRPGLSQMLAGLKPRKTSKREKVEQFQDWLYEEVLESIYDTGGYNHKGSTQSPISEELQQTLQTIAQGTAQLQQMQQQTRQELHEVKEDVDQKLQNRQLSEDLQKRSAESMREEINRLVRGAASNGAGHFAMLYDHIYDDVAEQTGLDVRQKYRDRGSKSILQMLTTNEMGVVLESARYLYD